MVLPQELVSEVVLRLDQHVGWHTGEAASAPGSIVCCHLRPPVVLGQLAMDLGISKVTTQSSTVSLIKESLPILSGRNDPQSLVLLHMVQNAVGNLILRGLSPVLFSHLVV